MLSDLTINIRGSLVDFSVPKVMGILNLTPDSFFAESRVQPVDAVVSRATAMVQEGADILDLGGYSSRPGADDVSVAEEIRRVEAPIAAIKQAVPHVVVSIDTFRAEVAKAAVAAGADMVNDISAGHLDANMLEAVAEMRVPYIAMHMRGTPQTMASLAEYDDIVHEVINYFSQVIARCHQIGIKDVIIDPGFGFAKSGDQSFELLSKLERLEVLEKPLLVGLSRKSMIYKTLKISPEEALIGTTVLNSVSLLKGAGILRVHDVKEAVQTIQLYKKLTP